MGSSDKMDDQMSTMSNVLGPLHNLVFTGPSGYLNFMDYFGLLWIYYFFLFCNRDLYPVDSPLIPPLTLVWLSA